MASDQKKVVISLGGSLIVPDDIDVPFLSSFKKLIEDYVAKGWQFLLITGGGKTARRYQKAAGEVADLSSDELDWVGIHATRLNGHFLRIIFKELAYEDVVTDPAGLPGAPKSVIVGAGWKPGWSTDFDAVELAEKVGAKRIINLSNIDYVYDKDPRTNKDAKRIEKISWSEFRKILPPPEAWNPGLNAPFDPVAAKRAEGFGIEVVVMNGKNLDNLKKALEGEDFEGTIIK